MSYEVYANPRPRKEHRTDTPNPFCACGCGYEVALPWNKYIQGHFGAIHLTEAERRELKKMLDAGESSYKIAAKFDRSQAQVLNWRDFGIPERKPADKVMRKEIIESMRRDSRALRILRSHARAGNDAELRAVLKQIRIGKIPRRYLTPSKPDRG